MTKKYTAKDLIRVRYANDPTADTFFQWEGSVLAFVPGEAPKTIFKCVGMNVSKARIENDKLLIAGRELTYYLDPKTGEKLKTWDNPWTGEKKLPVIHIANDPVQMPLPAAIPLEVRHNPSGGTSAILSEIPLFYPNPLYTEDHKFDVYDANRMYEAGELFTFKCTTEDLDQAETLDRVDVNWSRISKFAPFMKMGGKQGYLVYHCTGYKLPQGSTAEDLYPFLAKEICSLQNYAHAPEYDPQAKSVSSWTYFRDHFDRYQNEPEATWPF
ncbi:hypothetical protein CU098_005495 [Rhizopus stolonifer]|uniref:DUF1838 domain-containing protein n=1 Tax=Rhizopus stolonifer TaxID=4846 RepID=A0A367K5M9_RHIST|nr:hypothetical protein CU098_005495 [Rhizopus stolonifer]